VSAIASVRARPVDLELASPFEISLGTREAARNLLVRVETADATVGYGEASPLPPITGTTRDAADVLNIKLVKSGLLAPAGSRPSPRPPTGS
jgi:L-alanine-DL-glutamate epimerase-like enolase superfamily enzyme